MIDYAYGLATKYGEASSALACEWYDAIAQLERANVPAAVPAQTATYNETAKAINGAMKQSPSGQLLTSVVQRLVKQAAADTTLQNAKRDGAYFAWVPHGDTCPFCIALAANGWQKMSREAMKGNHAEHIHQNCDCEYAIRFGNNLNYRGYDPDQYRQMYDNADDSSQGFSSGHWQNESTAKINGMRRAQYAANKDEINAQKRAAYAKRIEIKSGNKEGE